VHASNSKATQLPRGRLKVPRKPSDCMVAPSSLVDLTLVAGVRVGNRLSRFEKCGERAWRFFWTAFTAPERANRTWRSRWGPARARRSGDELSARTRLQSRRRG